MLAGGFNIPGFFLVNIAPAYLAMAYLGAILLGAILLTGVLSKWFPPALAAIVLLAALGTNAWAIPGHGPKRYGDAPGFCIRNADDIVWKNYRPLRYKPHRGCAR